MKFNEQSGKLDQMDLLQFGLSSIKAGSTSVANLNLIVYLSNAIVNNIPYLFPQLFSNLANHIELYLLDVHSVIIQFGYTMYFNYKMMDMLGLIIYTQ